MRVATVESTQAWSLFPQTVAGALTEFVQRPLTSLLPASEQDTEMAVATITQFDTTNRVSLSIDLALDRRFIESIAHETFGETIDAASERAVLLECANIVMGAVKLSLEQEDHELTAGLPREVDVRDALVTFSKARRSQRHAFAVEDHAVEVRISLDAPNDRILRGADVREGMVVLCDVRDAKGCVIVPSGTRLSTTNVKRIVADAPAASIRVGGTRLASLPANDDR